MGQEEVAGDLQVAELCFYHTFGFTTQNGHPILKMATKRREMVPPTPGWQANVAVRTQCITFERTEGESFREDWEDQSQGQVYFLGLGRFHSQAPRRWRRWEEE